MLGMYDGNAAAALGAAQGLQGALQAPQAPPDPSSLAPAGGPTDPEDLQAILAALATSGAPAAAPDSAGVTPADLGSLAGIPVGAPPTGPPPGPPGPPAATPGAAGGAAATGDQAAPSDFLSRMAARIGGLGYNVTPGDQTNALRQALMTMGATMASRAGLPISEGGGWGALGSGIAAGVGGLNQSLARQAAAEEQSRRDDAAEQREDDRLSMEKERFSEQQKRDALADRRLQDTEQKAALSQKQDQAARLDFIRTVSSGSDSHRLLSMMGAPAGEFWKAANEVDSDTKPGVYEVHGVGLVYVDKDHNATTVVKEVRKPETDLFSPVQTDQGVGVFNKRTGEITSTDFGTKPGAGGMDHVAAAAGKLLSEAANNGDPFGLIVKGDQEKSIANARSMAQKLAAQGAPTPPPAPAGPSPAGPPNVRASTNPDELVNAAPAAMRPLIQARIAAARAKGDATDSYIAQDLRQFLQSKGYL